MEPMKERIAELQRLRKEHGSYESIPQSDLQAIEYIRHVDEQGILQVAPAEIFARRSLANSIDRKEIGQKPLFDELRLDLHSNEGFASTIPPEVFMRESDELFDEIEDYVAGDSEIRDVMYSQSATVMQAVYGVLSGDDDRDFSWPDYSDAIDDTIGAQDTVHNDPSYSMIIRDYLNLSDSDERYGSYAAETIWEGLERIKSGLTDPEVLDVITREQYGMYVGTLHDEDGVDIPAYHGRIADVLRSGGIETVATHIEAAVTIDEARVIVTEAMESNTVVDDLKKAEKELKSRMRIATSDEERHAINRDIHAVKAKRRDAMKIIYGVDALLHPAEAYVTYVTSRIKKLQEHFLNESDETITLTFDGKPDAEKDEDPGKLSGDCTEGAPLPFDKNVGAHNIKVSLDQRYMGNVYLLDTKDADGNHVWHLDAIQIPTIRIDWQENFKEIINMFAASAEKHGISMITINDRSELISNYDYIGDAATSMISDLRQERRLKTVEVQFPDSFSENTDFQGKSCEQCVVWSKPE